MEEATLTLAELLAEAAAAASLGDRAEAERLFRRATERSPGNSTAWLGLAAAVRAPEDKRACYEHVLAINPNNGEARIALQRLAGLANPEQASEIQTTLSNAAALVAADPARYAAAAAQAAGMTAPTTTSTAQWPSTRCCSAPTTRRPRPPCAATAAASRCASNASS